MPTSRLSRSEGDDDRPTMPRTARVVSRTPGDASLSPVARHMTPTQGRWREEFLYWLKLRLRRRKARGPASGTPRCGRRWRAVLAHPTAPTLLHGHGSARPVDSPRDGRLVNPWQELRRQDEGSPSRRRSGTAPWRTTAHLERMRGRLPAQPGAGSAFCAALPSPCPSSQCTDPRRLRPVPPVSPGPKTTTHQRC